MTNGKLSSIHMQKLLHQTHSFGEFTLDLTRGCLRRDHEDIKLRPKSFEVLKYLVENNGRLISKNELIRAVWIDTAVTDDSLVQCLKDIRHALRDETQHILKTVHGRGYIFDSEVRENGSAPLTTYTEETAAVQVIIEEEETNGHGVIETSPFSVSGSVGLISAHKAIGVQRLRSVVTRPKWTATLGILTLVTVVVASGAIIYFTRPGEAIESIAVMPFINVNGDPNTEYLSDGISDSIINNLSQLPDLKKVISFNSVLRYKGKQADAKLVGRELGVRAVLMGRLTHRGDDLLINVELVDVRDNRHLWGHQYNRKLADITTVPTEIAQEISEKLRLRLTGEDKQRLAKRYTQSGEAYQLFMLGRYYRRRHTKEGYDKSIEYLEQAIKKDPTYAPAYAEMGEVYRNLGWNLILPPKEWLPKEELAALKALQIDDGLAEAHVLKAHLNEIYLDWRAAENEYKYALELDPNSARAHETYAWHLEMFGRLDEASLHLKRAQELDPLGLELMWDVAVLFQFSRQHDRAIEQLKKIIEMDPNHAAAHTSLAVNYQEKGLYEEAITALKKVNAGRPQLGYAYAVAGKREEAQKILAGLKEDLSKGRYVSPFGFAVIYMGLGDKDQAFEWLNKTFEENPYRIAFLKVNPRFDSLRSDPRFDDLLRRMKLVP